MVKKWDCVQDVEINQRLGLLLIPSQEGKSVIDAVGYIMNSGVEESNKDIQFPSIFHTLEEIRHLFDIEESRRQSLENKAGIIIGFIGVVLTIVPLFSKVSIVEIFPFYIFIIVSLIFGLLSIRLTKYTIPHKKYDDFYKYAKMDEKTAMDKFLLNYIEAAKNTEEKNDSKVFFLRLSFLFILLAGLFIFGRAVYIAFIM